MDNKKRWAIAQKYELDWWTKYCDNIDWYEEFAKTIIIEVSPYIEISNDKSGKPLIKLKGRTLLLFKKRIKSKKYQIDLSLSDDNPWAHATVIISCYK